MILINLSTVIIWSLVAYGITNIITQSRIFETSRNYIGNKFKYIKNFIKCPMCVGFWVGLFLSLFWQSITDNMFLDGILSSAISWLLFCHSTGYCLLMPEQLEPSKRGCSNCGNK